MSSRGVVYVDETVDLYRNLRLPSNWTAHYEPEWRSLQGSLQWCLEAYPDATQYGWLADDTRPRTQGWDKLIEAVAADWNLAYARDLWSSEDPVAHAALVEGRDLSSGLCWGGELIRAVGWWALPGVRQAGIDTAWTEIVRPLQRHRYLPDVTVEHLHYKTGKRPKDDGDSWDRNGDPYVDRDLVTRNQWVWSRDYRNLLRRLLATVPATGPDEVLQAMRQSRVDELWSAGSLPAARLHRILAGDVDLQIAAWEPDPDARNETKVGA